MKLKSTIYVIGIMTIVSSFGIPQADYDKVIAENKDLKTNIEKVTSEYKSFKPDFEQLQKILRERQQQVNNNYSRSYSSTN